MRIEGTSVGKQLTRNNRPKIYCWTLRFGGLRCHEIYSEARGENLVSHFSQRKQTCLTFI